MTMMGGYVECPFVAHPGPQTCSRLPRWSNPAQTHGGQPLGVAGVANMVNALNIQMPIASDWRQYPGWPPTAPGSLSVVSDSCYGYHEVDWPTQPDATSYRLFRSNSASFTLPVLIYDGPSSNIAINVPNTSYLRVQACHAGGCSGYSPQRVATYTNGCY